MNTLTLAIDPGRSGGIAVRYPDGCVMAHAMPESDADVLELLRGIVSAARMEGWQPSALVEKVGGFVGKGQPGSAMFNFGQGYGFALGALMALEVPVRLVRPQQWQAALQLGRSGSHESKPAWKRHLRAEAARRFPHLKVTLATADALLLLDAAGMVNGTEVATAADPGPA